jgi:hypothetical protein
MEVFNSASAASPRTNLWKNVEDAVNKGLPQTAISNLNLILPAAMKDRAYGEAAKAMARKIVLEGNIQGNKPEEKIARMNAEIARAPQEILPLLETLRAHWYWHYFQQNRWRFLQRTATAQAPGKDFTTWDLPRLFAEIDRQFQQALSHADTLKKTPVSVFDDLLQKGTLPDIYRPTLFDFIAQEALKFYTSGEQAGAKAEDAFELSADSPALDDVEKFLAWHRTFGFKSFPDSSILKALDLYGQVLTFHQRDPDPSALIDTDLARLQYAFNTAFGDNKVVRYQAALKGFVDKWADHEVSALALQLWARLVRDAGDWVEARKLAQRGENAHPNSPGGRLCHNLIQEIEAKSASITTERVWNSPTGVSLGADAPKPSNETVGGIRDRRDAVPTLAVRYRNVTRVYFRAVAYDWDLFLRRQRSRPEYLNDNERKELLAKSPTIEWSAPLPPTPDFKEHVEELPAPASLKPGFYFLLASHRPDFSDSDNQVSYTDVWVSDLALVVFTRDGKVEGFVLNAVSGEPIAAAEVATWYLDNQGNRMSNGAPVSTDTNGWFRVTPKENRALLLRARANGQELGSMHEYYPGQPSQPQPQNTAVFFTDRALYRPGQTISYKGILVRVDQEKDQYEALAGRVVEVVFADPNGKEVAQFTHRTSDYGSFTGSCTAPRDRLMGQYSLRVISGGRGSANFNIEEYKRPKFQVTLDAPKTAPKLNDKVNLQGKAEAYTGAAVDTAQVKWRVVREVRWPDWWYGWGWDRRGGRRSSASQEMAHGTAVTGSDGTFQIEFFAKPDPKIDEKSEATFRFRVYADVTDSAGETRSADRMVHVGFVALAARVSVEDWLTDDQPVALAIRTTTLDGEPQVAEGALKIHRLQEPARVQRPRLAGVSWRGDLDNDGKPDPDLSNPNDWPLGEVVLEKGFTTDAEGQAAVQTRLGVGVYRAMLETQDRFGKKVTARTQITVLQPSSAKLSIKMPHLFTAPKWQGEPGEDFMALWGTGYETGRAFVEIEHHGQVIQRYWTQPVVTQHPIKQSITEAMRGGFTVHVTQVRENRAYFESRRVDVPWSNKDLELKWEHFTSKLGPSQKETWTAVIERPRRPEPKQFGRRVTQLFETEKTVAEMVATLYDESLDAFRKHAWLQKFGFFRQDYGVFSADFCNVAKQFNHIKGSWRSDYRGVVLRYREFPADLIANFWGYGYPNRLSRARGIAAMDQAGGEDMAMAIAPATLAATPQPMALGEVATEATASFGLAKAGRANGEDRAELKEDQAMASSPAVDLSKVSARKNLNETAFFFPQLTSDSNGVVRMTFTMPEALTTWRFLGFAHDKDLRSGFLEGKTVTAKDLMVQPNPPRFLREGDTLEFTVKVSNQTAARQQGKVRLTLDDAFQSKADASLEPGPAGRLSAIDKRLGNLTPELAFDIPAKESRSYAWRITVPDGTPFLTYQAVGSTGKVSDGEEGYLPVLSRRIFVTESLPLPIRGKAGGGEVVKRFEFTKLLNSGKSQTLRHQSLTVQMVSNPAWYAVMALPYLMEFPYECAEQTFNRFYANALARSIANSDPKIRRVFDLWQGTSALDSPLEKNQDLKSVMIEETPWYRQAQNESQARQNVGILFNDNRLNSEMSRAFLQLQEMQLGDGTWPWFPGGRGNDYITLYITTGFGRLRHLGVDVDVQCAVKSLNRLDQWMNEHYRVILTQPDPDQYVPSPTDAFYLYGRSFFIKDKPVAKQFEGMLNFFLKQSRTHWLQTNWRQTQGHLAIALKRWGGDDNIAAARDIMRSIKERSVTNDELGRFWRDLELSWWWFRAPIETQALMIEAFDEVMGDAQAVEDCRVWLLKQKQTQDWKTTKATADAIYALLLRGKDILASDKLVEVTVGGIPVTPGKARAESAGGLRAPVEPGTGFYERRFVGAEIKPKLGEITVRKTDEGVSWGSVHWQYLEDMTRVTPYEGTPLKLKKTLFTKTHTKKGPVLEPVKGPLAIGDELVVRIELRVDRDMEYLHLKDQRASGTEPVNVISRYRYQDGLAYYESTRDTASHFFIDYLPKGTYVFEYATRIQHRGQYQTGLAEIQCLYAPEFNSHSESFAMTVK